MHKVEVLKSPPKEQQLWCVDRFRDDRSLNLTSMRKAVHLFGKAFRETGQALDRLGLKVAEHDIYKETFSRHRPVMNLFDKVKLKCNTKHSNDYFIWIDFISRDQSLIIVHLWLPTLQWSVKSF